LLRPAIVKLLLRRGVVVIPAVENLLRFGFDKRVWNFVPLDGALHVKSNARPLVGREVINRDEFRRINSSCAAVMVLPMRATTFR
jgi:hypothetical protein